MQNMQKCRMQKKYVYNIFTKWTEMREFDCILIVF